MSKYMNIYSKPGTKVRFTANGGYDAERDSAKKHLELGGVYTVREIEVDRYSSLVTLEEMPVPRFNTSLFEVVDSE